MLEEFSSQEKLWLDMTIWQVFFKIKHCHLWSFAPGWNFQFQIGLEKKVCHRLISTGSKKYNFYFFLPRYENIFTLDNIAHVIKLNWKLIAVTRCNHTELTPSWTFSPACFTPGLNFTSGSTCDYWQMFLYKHG